jgi:hypothetical protein
LVVTEKDLQQARKDNQALDRYINAKKKKEEARKKEEKIRKKAKEEARKKVMEDQSSNDVQIWRSSHPWVVQGTLPLPASFE